MQYVKRIKALRIDRDLKQVEIAKILGISQQQYSLIEKGYRELHIDQLEKLCIFYNVSADYIIGFTFEPKELPRK